MGVGGALPFTTDFPAPEPWPCSVRRNKYCLRKMLLGCGWGQRQGLFPGRSIGEGWSNQGGLPGKGVAGPPPLPSAHHTSWVPADPDCPPEPHCHRQPLGFAHERAMGHLKRS